MEGRGRRRPGTPSRAGRERPILMTTFIRIVNVSKEPYETSPLLQHHCAEKKLPSASKCPKGIHSSAEQVRDKKCIEEVEGKNGSLLRAKGGEGWLDALGGHFPPSPTPSPRIKFQCAPIYFVHWGEKISPAPFCIASVPARGSDDQSQSAFTNLCR